MFSLSKLKLQNWCQHEDLTVEFSPGTNGIIGSNGCGKSNILAAAFTMLTGRTLTDTLPEAINYDADSTNDELEFSIDGTPGAIKRRYTATRRDGNPNNRDTVKSSASLKYGGEKIVKGVSNVNKALDGLAGFSAQMLQTHVFITQDTMSELLFQSAQERLRSFMSLIPELSKAEKMRSALLAEASLFPDIELAVSSGDYAQQLKECDEALTELTSEYDEAKLALGTVNVPELQAIVAAYNKGNAIDIDAIRARLDEAHTYHDDKVVEQGELDIEAQKLREQAPEGSEQRLDTLKAAVASAAANKREADRKQELERSLAALVSEVEAREAPVSKSSIDDAELEQRRARANELAAEITAHKKVLDVLARGGECPTCGNKFSDPEKERASHTSAHSEAVKVHGELVASILAEDNARAEYARQLAEHKAWVNATEQRLLATQKELKTMAATNTADIPADTDSLTAEIRRIDAALRRLRDIENKSAALTAIIESAQRRISELEAELVKAEELRAGMPDQAKVDDANARLELSTQYTSAVARTEGALAAQRTERGRIVAAMEKARAMEDRSKAVTQWKHMLNSARDTLHRDNLPEEVLASYIGSLESACNKFLEMFGSPFAVMIGRGMNIRCSHPNGYVASARRLSAGQKCVLSVAMRFAINELFAGNFGLIILDEPTAFMDDDNIEYMRELISYIRGISQTTGIQTIIITHHKELISSFDNVIRV